MFKKKMKSVIKIRSFKNDSHIFIHRSGESEKESFERVKVMKNYKTESSIEIKETKQSTVK